MRFLMLTHIHIFFTLFNQKNPPKNRYTRKEPTHFSVKPENLNFKKNFFRNLKILKFSMLKKMTPKSQAKNKTPFPQYPFLTIF